VEAGLISERTKAALAAAKARGVRLGNPRPAEALEQGRAALKAAADRRAANVLPIIRAIQEGGIKSPAEIAEALNARNVRTARGRDWSRVQVGRVLARAGA
jgi:DNA invertase Pin-like site-specific DNA recombinase